MRSGLFHCFFLISIVYVSSVSAKENFKYYSLDPQVFVSKVRGMWNEKYPHQKLDVNIANQKSFRIQNLFSGNTFLIPRTQAWEISKFTPGYPIHLPAKHKELLAWLLSQENGSVRPENFLFRSLEITKGNIFEALLIGWDILSAGWESNRSRPPHRRESFLKTQKLGFMPHTEGNLFSGWYHFWGTMIFSFYYTALTKQPVLGKGAATLAIAFEEFVGAATGLFCFIPPDEMIHRCENDLNGARAGVLFFAPEDTLKKGGDLVTVQRFTLKEPLRRIRKCMAILTQPRFLKSSKKNSD